LAFASAPIEMGATVDHVHELFAYDPLEYAGCPFPSQPTTTHAVVDAQLTSVTLVLLLLSGVTSVAAVHVHALLAKVPVATAASSLFAVPMPAATHSVVLGQLMLKNSSEPTEPTPMGVVADQVTAPLDTVPVTTIDVPPESTPVATHVVALAQLIPKSSPSVDASGGMIVDVDQFHVLLANVPTE
jgi:hypothetical protein